MLVDYSGGTGILLDRLRLRIFDRQVGMVIVDSSPKFLRVAVERLATDERVAFRRLRFLREERRLEYVDEALGPTFPGADHLVSTNAIHLYENLDATLAAWARVLRPGGRVRINSGNLRNPRAAENEWIIDETVYVVHEVATGLVRTDPRWAAYRDVLDDEERMQAYLDLARPRLPRAAPARPLPRRAARGRLPGRRRDRSRRSRRASRSGTSSSPPTPTPCSAGSAGRRRSTAWRRRRRRRRIGSTCSASL